MTAAIFGLIGVIVGGFINGGLAWWTRRVDRRAERRVAARIVFEELSSLEDTLSVSADHAVALENFPLDMPAWREFRTTLALGLAASEWARVSGAYQSLALANSMLRSVEVGAPLTKDQRKQLEQVALDAGDGYGALKPFAEGWSPELDRRDGTRAIRKALKQSDRWPF